MGFLAAPTQEPSQLPIKVLYAGHLETERAKAFQSFFSKHVEKSGTTDLAKFDGTQAPGYDLVLLDYRSGETPGTSLPANYTTPTVVIGWEGVRMVDKGRFKGSNYW